MSKQTAKCCTFAIVLLLTQCSKLFCMDGKGPLCVEPRKFQLMFQDEVLTRSVIAIYNVTSLAECLLHCFENQGCRSCNYELERNSSQKLRLCELNNKTLSSCSNRKVGKEGYSHFEETDGPRKELYGSERNPGLSCMDINSCRRKDGEYWVSNKETSWNVVKVICFMSTMPKGPDINIALNKATTQSSTFSNSLAKRAVDGNRESAHNKGSCSHTSAKESSPWWRVDLGNVYYIRKLIITNRSDCCYERLSNFEIRIGLSVKKNGISNPLCGGNHSLAAETKSIVCPQLMLGRYVYIIKPKSNTALALCEVEVYP